MSLSHVRHVCDELDTFWKVFEHKLQYRIIRKVEYRSQAVDESSIKSLIALRNNVPLFYQPVCDWHIWKYQYISSYYSKNRGPDTPGLLKLLKLCPCCERSVENLRLEYEKRSKKKVSGSGSLETVDLSSGGGSS